MEQHLDFDGRNVSLPQIRRRANGQSRARDLDVLDFLRDLLFVPDRRFGGIPHLFDRDRTDQLGAHPQTQYYLLAALRQGHDALLRQYQEQLLSSFLPQRPGDRLADAPAARA